MQIADKYKKISSTSLLIRELKIKNHVEQCLSSTKGCTYHMANSERYTIISVGENMQKWNPHMVVRISNSKANLENILAVIKKYETQN